MVVGMGGSNSVEVEVQSKGTDTFASSMDNAVASLGGIAGAARIAGGALAALAATGIAAAIDATRDYNSEIRELTKVTDPLAADRIASDMVELSREIPLATEELFNLATQAARFGVAEDHIDEFTETVAMMAFATDISVEEAGRAFAKLSSITATPIDEIRNLGSSINSLGQTTATSAGEIVDGMLRSSAALSQLGLGADEIVGLQASLNAVSESSERAGTRLRRVAESLMDPSTVRDLATSLLDVDDASGLLSDSAETVRGRLLKERDALNDLKNELADFDEQLAEVSDKHDNFRDAVRENRIQIEEIRLKAAKQDRELTDAEKARIDDLQTANDELRLKMLKLESKRDDIREKREDAAEAVEKEKEKVSELTDEFVSEFQQLAKEDPAQFIAKLAEAMADGGPAAEAMASEFDSVAEQALRALGANDDLRENLETAGTSYDEATSILREYNIEAGSLGAKQQRLNNRFKNSLAVIGGQFTPMLHAVVDATTQVASAFETWNEANGGMAASLGLVVALVGGLALAIGGLNPPVLAIIGLVATLAAAWNSNFGNIRGTFETVMAKLNEVWDTQGETLFFQIEDILDDLRAFWTEWGDEIEWVVGNLFDIIGGIIVTAFDLFLTIINTGLALIRGDWEGAFIIIRDFVFRTFDRVLGYFDSWFPGLHEKFNKGVGLVKEYFVGGIRGAVDLAKGAFNAYLGWVENIFGKNIADAFANLARDIADAFLGPIRWAVEKANELMGGNAPGLGDPGDDSPPSSGGGGGGGGGPRPAPRVSGGAVMAKGGIVTRPTSAIIGEGGESEAVLPLSKLDEFVNREPRATVTNNYDVTVNANSRSEGRDAARGFLQELRSSNIKTS
jgi:hypothetical protein